MINESNCPMWDEFHGCCMYERLEAIFQYPWEKPKYEDCFEEMP